jgi:hypothetical protein
LAIELTIEVNDAPMITPVARSTTSSRVANFWNCSNIGVPALEIGAWRLVPDRDFNNPSASKARKKTQPAVPPAINLNFDATVKGGELEAAYEPPPGLKFHFAGGYGHIRLADGS